MSNAGKWIDIDGTKIHYTEAGSGDPILFLHGIPASGYIWRNIIPHLATLGRCIAPDLVGMGQSDKPNIDYSLKDHIHFIEKFINALNLKRITLIMHGWGSVIGFDYAMRHEKNCKGLVFYEAFLRSLNDSEISLPYQEQLLSYQETLTESFAGMDGVSFIEKTIPQYVMRTLSNDEMEHYRKPFLNENASKSLWQYIKELPNGNNEIDHFIADYTKKLTKSNLPKLMLYSVPGFITTIATVMWAKEHLPNIEIIDIGEELHMAQESSPDVFGETISVWMQGVEQTCK
jgi:haloalkane dehalogenase